MWPFPVTATPSEIISTTLAPPLSLSSRYRRDLTLPPPWEFPYGPDSDPTLTLESQLLREPRSHPPTEEGVSDSRHHSHSPPNLISLSLLPRDHFWAGNPFPQTFPYSQYADLAPSPPRAWIEALSVDEAPSEKSNPTCWVETVCSRTRRDRDSGGSLFPCLPRLQALAGDQYVDLPPSLLCFFQHYQGIL